MKLLCFFYDLTSACGRPFFDILLNPILRSFSTDKFSAVNSYITSFILAKSLDVSYISASIVFMVQLPLGGFPI